jgi:O-antigen/teichoic acid export membrane protein
MPRIWRQVINAGGARLWSLAMSVLILAVSARALGEAGRGEFAAVFAWATITSSVLYLSLGQVGLHDAIGRERDPVRRGRLLSTLAAFALSASVVGWLTAGTLWLITDGQAFRPIGPAVLAVGLLLLPVLIWEQFGSTLLAMEQRVDIYNRAQVIGRSIAAISVGLALALGAGIYGLLLGILAGQAWVALRGVTYLLGTSERIPPSAAYARHLISRGLRLHLSAVATVLIASADVLIVAHQLGAASAGSYQVAIQLLLALTVLPQAATLVIYGQVASGGAQGAWEEHRRVAAAVLITVAGLSVLAWLAAPIIIGIVVGHGFHDAVGVFRIVVVAAVGYSFSALMAPQWIGRGLFGLASGLTVGLATMNVAANLILIPREGLDGAAAVVVGTSVLMLAANGLLAVHCERNRIPAARQRSDPSRRAASGSGGTFGP